MTKQKWIVLIIALVVIALVICAIKFLPWWATALSVGSLLFGTFCGYKLKDIFKK